MEAIQTFVNAVVIGAVGLLLARLTRGLRSELKADIAGLRSELKADIASLRSELKADIRDLRGELSEMRSDLTRVALAVGAERRAGSN